MSTLCYSVSLGRTLYLMSFKTLEQGGKTPIGLLVFQPPTLAEETVSALWAVKDYSSMT